MVLGKVIKGTSQYLWYAFAPLVQGVESGSCFVSGSSSAIAPRGSQTEAGVFASTYGRRCFFTRLCDFSELARAAKP